MARGGIILPTRPKHPPCIFCGKPADSKEHAWQRWLIKRLRKQIGSEVLIGIDMNGTQLRPRTSLFKRDAFCEDCNTHWMHNLEDETIPIMEPLLLGQQRSLNASKQFTLATWTALRALVFDCFSPYRFYEPRDTSHLFRNVSPPSSTFGIWLGHCAEPLALTVGYRLRGKAGDRAIEGNTQTMVFGHLVIQILSIPESATEMRQAPVRDVRVDAISGPWDGGGVVSVWPLNFTTAVAWPPPHSFKFATGEVDDFAKRFNTGASGTPLP